MGGDIIARVLTKFKLKPHCPRARGCGLRFATATDFRWRNGQRHHLQQRTQHGRDQQPMEESCTDRFRLVLRADRWAAIAQALSPTRLFAAASVTSTPIRASKHHPQTATPSGSGTLSVPARGSRRALEPPWCTHRVRMVCGWSTDRVRILYGYCTDGVRMVYA
jgi:hypothetical protein